MRSAPSGVGDLLSGVGFLVLSGHVGWHNLPHTVLAVGASCLTFTASGVLFFSLAFWLRRSESLARQLWEITLTFALYPDPLFGGGLKLVLYTLIPAGIATYLPLHAVVDATLSDVMWMLFATVSYVLAAIFVFQRGLGRYCSGSRFGTFG
jgi:ABC-2 type transport system permease protein